MAIKTTNLFSYNFNKSFKFYSFCINVTCENLDVDCALLNLSRSTSLSEHFLFDFRWFRDLCLSCREDGNLSKCKHSTAIKFYDVILITLPRSIIIILEAPKKTFVQIKSRSNILWVFNCIIKRSHLVHKSSCDSFITFKKLTRIDITI